MKVLGIVLIVLAVVSGASSMNSLDQKADAEKLSPESRQRQKIGSGIATLLFIGGGFYLIRAGERNAARQREQHHRNAPPGQMPWDRDPEGER
ncbi:MAG: hypothetical protein C0501_06120 [Isosphaera sp.]|nr:hypothetical protein [Isosphaera sp.]